MKVRHSSIAVFFAVLFICTACPAPNRDTAQKRLENNNMDFPDLLTHYYEGINFQLSDLFEYSYYDEFVLTDDADTKAINELDIYFSVEKFSNQDAEIISYEFDENILLVDAVHDNYILKRENSLYNSDVSVKKELPEEVPYNGYIQVVHGFNYDYDDGSSYFTATLEVGRDCYVFQLIGKKENLVYLHDDFIDLLASVTE